MFTIGKIAKPQGIKGEVKVEIITSFPEHFLDLDELIIEMNDGLRTYSIESVRLSDRFAFIKFTDIHDRNAAETLRNKKLLIPEDELRELEQDEFYIHHLIGMDVYDENNSLLGKIEDVVQSVSGDTFVMKTPDNVEILVPAVKDFIRDVNLNENKITIHVIDGLLDVNENN
jgi:16S rRNA processing protein RimM